LLSDLRTSLELLGTLLVVWVELGVNLWWRSRRRSSTSLEIFKTSLQLLAVIPLGDTVLDSSTLSEVGYLSPILVWIGRAAESTAGTMVCDLPWGRGSGVGIALSRHFGEVVQSDVRG